MREELVVLTKSQLKGLVSEAVAQGIERVYSMLLNGVGDYLREEEASLRIGVSKAELRSMRKAGTGPAYYDTPQGVRYKLSDLHEYMETSRVDPLL